MPAAIPDSLTGGWACSSWSSITQPWPLGLRRKRESTGQHPLVSRRAPAGCWLQAFISRALWFLLLCKANPPSLVRWLLTDIYTSKSRIRPAESQPACPHGNRCGMLQSRSRSSNSARRSSSPAPRRRALQQEGGASPDISILSLESEPLLFRGKKWKCNQISLYSANRKSVLIKPEEMQSSRL